MHAIIQFFYDLYISENGLSHLIESGGLFVLIAIVFSETGLLLGFFLPGDALLVTAGIFASETSPLGHALYSPWVLGGSLIAAAFCGDQVNYWAGRRTGQAIFTREDSRFFKKKYAIEAHNFYLEHGGFAVIIGRFIPMLRTFVPFIAGVAEMTYRRYLFFSIVGACSWVGSMVTLGYVVGQTPWGKKLHLVILTVIFISFLPLIFSTIKQFIAYKRGQALASPKSEKQPVSDSK